MSGHVGDLIEPPEPRASAFKVIRKNPVTLRVGADIDATFEFFFGKGARTNSQGIISFNLVVRSDDLTLGVDLNDTVGFEQDYLPGPQRVVQKVIEPAGKFGTNKLTFTVAKGSCRISDVIIWYYVDP